MEERDNHYDDPILDYAIEYKTTGSYLPTLTKEKKRAIRKRAASLISENGEIYLEWKKRKVKVIRSTEEQVRIMRACHADPTSGHFGTTKTWRRVAKRVYWRGMATQIKDMVCLLIVTIARLHALIYS